MICERGLNSFTYVAQIVSIWWDKNFPLEQRNQQPLCLCEKESENEQLKKRQESQASQQFIDKVINLQRFLRL